MEWPLPQARPRSRGVGPRTQSRGAVGAGRDGRVRAASDCAVGSGEWAEPPQYPRAMSSVGTGGAQVGVPEAPPTSPSTLPHRAHSPARRPPVAAGWSPEGRPRVEYGGAPARRGRRHGGPGGWGGPSRQGARRPVGAVLSRREPAPAPPAGSGAGPRPSERGTSAGGALGPRPRRPVPEATWFGRGLLGRRQPCKPTRRGVAGGPPGRAGRHSPVGGGAPSWTP